jgi:hypothetical protein
MYVFVNLKGDGRPEYVVVPSGRVAAKTLETKSSTGSVWYEFRKSDRLADGEGWELFGHSYCAQRSGSV